MLKRIEGNGVRTMIVGPGSRFARDLMVQEVGYEFDKAMTVAKLRGARDRKRKDGATRTRRDGGAKVEGRKNHAELRPQVMAEAKRLRRKRPKGGQRSYRQIATELFQGGYCNFQWQGLLAIV